MEKSSIKHSYSRSWRFGEEQFWKQEKEKIDPLNAISETENGKLVFAGKIIDVTEKGYNFGQVYLNFNY